MILTGYGSSDILSIYVSLLSHLFLVEKFTLTPPFLSPAALRYPPPPAPITCLKVITSLSLITVIDVCMYVLLLLQMCMCPRENRLSSLQHSLVAHSSLSGAGPHEIFPLPRYNVHWYCCCSSLAYTSISRRTVSRRFPGILALIAFLTPLLRHFLSCRYLNCECICWD